MKKFALPLLTALLLLSLTACGGKSKPISRTANVDGETLVVCFDDSSLLSGHVTSKAGSGDVYTFAYNGNGALSITYPDGFVFWSGSAATPEGYSSGSVLKRAVSITRDSIQELNTREPFPYYTLALFALGLWLCLSPQSAWQLGRGWEFKDAEPSDLALVVYRTIGAVAIFGGVLFILNWL